jgi:MmeI, DNA-methyltransferase domain/MmeI, target recognition domain/MmeI, N-terminal domain/MmeI, helicase spacer domain/MmeI, C-terminal domain
MPISWNDIRHNAIRFSNEWAGETREEAEGKSFWDEFFTVFGIRRWLVATFEEPIKNIRGKYGFIDLFWPQVVLVEHKSFGKDLGKAGSQAFRYIQDLAREGRLKEIPRYVIVSDFARIALHDLEPEETHTLPLFEGRRVATIEFPLAAFHRHIHDFAFIPGYKQHKFAEQDPINIEAVEILGQLHDVLESGGYTGHNLERFLVRILFCLFAEDTGLFERDAFRLYLENRTAEDGSDLGLHLAQLFDVLDTPPEKRQTNLDETLAAFPYVNGDLFAEKLGFADFNRDMRNALLACTRSDWSRISPAIFGSLFQAVMAPKERRQIGGHYTSERDILKVIRSLFLDALRGEFESIKADRSSRRRARLEEFHAKLCRLHVLDPACGCGNFLVITYRELRQLELEVLKELFGRQTEMTLAEINRLSQVDVDQLYGIEIGEWPARIAEVALWLMDHQMNLKVSAAFGQFYQRLPLKKSPHIHCANALRADWKQILPPAQCSYVLGNPPFVGAKFQTDAQRADMDAVAGDVENHGLLDYVTGWYFKAADYIQGTRVVVGFVSTNSISQGEQAGTLWNHLFQHSKLKIHFAHRTFAWESEARGKAHVHVVIIGFGAGDAANKRIYDYETGTPTVSPAKNVSPYLVEGSDMAITNRSKPICDVPEMGIGNKPIDNGNYLFTPEEKAEFLRDEPAAEKYFRRWIGSEELINGIERWCLWLGDCPPGELRKMPRALARVEAVREFRLASKSVPTRKIAATPTRFHVENFPQRNYLVVPEVSSERRPYIPIGFVKPEIISSNLVKVIPDATLFHFGVLSSAMHMAWVRQVCGRLESRYRYSNKLVYNNFPWPEKCTDARREAVENRARRVVELRKEFGDGRHGFLPARKSGGAPATLADLYDPLAMPPALVKAHAELDRAVDLCYRREPFETERQRVEYLFALYEKLTAPLLPATKSKRARRGGNDKNC